MASFLFILLVLVVTALLGLALGMWVASRDQESQALPYFISVGTGVLLSVCFFEFLPVALEGKIAFSSFLIFMGVVAVMFCEKVIAPIVSSRISLSEECHHKDHGHTRILTKEAACTSIGCILVCAFFDGLGLVTGLMMGKTIGVILGLGILSHMVPSGALAAGLAIGAGFGQKGGKNGVILVFVATILGGLSGLLLSEWVDFNSNVLPLATGILLYVSFTHLIPASLKVKWGFLGLLVGLVFVSVILKFFHVH